MWILILALAAFGLGQGYAYKAARFLRYSPIVLAAHGIAFLISIAVAALVAEPWWLAVPCLLITTLAGGVICNLQWLKVETVGGIIVGDIDENKGLMSFYAAMGFLIILEAVGFCIFAYLALDELRWI